jgi:hypothetical protein
LQKGPTVIPTLAARSRQRQLQDLARTLTHPPCQVVSEPPLALQSYLQTADSTPIDRDPPPVAVAGVVEPALDAQPPEDEALQARRPMPIWLELLL